MGAQGCGASVSTTEHLGLTSPGWLARGSGARCRVALENLRQPSMKVNNRDSGAKSAPQSFQCSSPGPFLRAIHRRADTSVCGSGWQEDCGPFSDQRGEPPRKSRLGIDSAPESNIPRSCRLAQLSPTQHQQHISQHSLRFVASTEGGRQAKYP